MIKTFKNKDLRELAEAGRTAKIDRRLQKRMLLILDALDRAKQPNDMNLPGLDFHRLHGLQPPRYTVHVNGPWCVTFEFEGEHVARVDFEQYH